MAVFTDLPLDVIDRVFMTLPDFQTLAAAIMVCKECYNVFQTHPKSIVHAVASNIVGPAIPQALELVHVQEDVEEIESEEIPTITRAQAVALAWNVHTVSRLEDLYSISHKDRTSSTSKLSGVDSLRFCRALYRLWRLQLVLTFVEPDNGDYVSDDEDDDSQNDDTSVDRCAQVAVMELSSIDDKELHELDVVFHFLTKALEWASKALKVSSYVSSYPRVPRLEELANAFETQNIQFFANDVGIASVDTAIGAVFDDRHISNDTRETERSKGLLDEVIGENDACFRCYGVQGLKLWGHANFSLFPCQVDAYSLHNKLEGRLPRNRVETEALNRVLVGLSNGGHAKFDWQRFFDELCDISVDAEGPWDKDQWYCIDCIDALLRSRLRLWWVAKKRELNIPFKDDCWYGYACRTQAHKITHASKLNHLCAPTRGDGYIPAGTPAGVTW